LRRIKNKIKREMAIKYKKSLERGRKIKEKISFFM